MKTAIVTGGSSGLGAAIAKAAVAAGYRVGSLDVDLAKGGAFAETLGNCVAYQCDIKNELRASTLIIRAAGIKVR